VEAEVRAQRDPLVDSVVRTQGPGEALFGDVAEVTGRDADVALRGE
jgi:hypothetical protein